MKVKRLKMPSIFWLPSTVVLGTWPCKMFFTSKFTYLLFCNPNIKRKLRQQKNEGLLIANHLDQSLWWANQKRWSESDHICYTLFCRCTALLRISPATAHLCGAKTIFLSQTSTFWIFFIQFYCIGSHTVTKSNTHTTLLINPHK